MSLICWIALLVVLATVFALIKRIETRLVLFTSGLILCIISLNPLSALDAFAKSMTNGSLITAICTSMAFAMVSHHTKCDQHLVALLAGPIRGLGLLLIPICTAVTIMINVAIPSAAGTAAAVGSTLIPVLLRAGVSPAGAAASVMLGTVGGLLSPGTSHNVYIAKMAGMEILDFIGLHLPFTMILYAFVIIGGLATAILFKDHKQDASSRIDETKKVELVDKPNIVYAVLPLLPIIILVLGNTVVPQIKMGVAQAMLLGAIICLLITRVNPEEFCSTFFKGLGKGYSDVLGIIIAAGVFAEGLRTTGLIDVFIDLLKSSNEIARWGGSLGPWILGVMTGSGDASTFAFNEAVTPHAAEFGMEVPNLGALAFLTGTLGRTSSPIAGAMIVVSGLAMVSPVEVAKRTVIPCFLAVVVLALIMV